MTKQQIVEALKFHEVPEKSSDVCFIEDKISKMYDCFHNRIIEQKPPTIELDNVRFDTYDEWFRALFNVVNTINGKTVSTTIEDFGEMDWVSHEDLARQLLELETFASSLRVLTTSDLQRWENMVTEIQARPWVCAFDLDELREEIMSVKM